MRKLELSVLMLVAGLSVRCGDSGDGMVNDAGQAGPDTPRPDNGVPDGGVNDRGGPVDFGNADNGMLDVGTPDVGVPDFGPQDAGPPPPQTVNVSGKVRKLFAYLARADEAVGDANILAFGVGAPAPTDISSNVVATLGDYALDVPASGQVIFYVNKLGYFPSYNRVTTQITPITGQYLYLAELAAINAIAAAHNVDLTTPAACHGPASVPPGNLNPADQCIYTALVGQILDDGTAGAGTLRPVAGVAAANFALTGGANDGTWYKKGPYFLDYTGAPAATATQSITLNDNGDYRGGLFVIFAEIPQTVGPESVDLKVNITYPALGGNRYFGPLTYKGFRPYAVSWAKIYETLQAPVNPIVNINFDTQVYPLFLPVTNGGFGCISCHTNQNGATPTGGMNLYGGPDIAYASLNPATYPLRVNITPGMETTSLLLAKPLYEAVGPQNHPIFAFTSPQDAAYQIILQWITEDGIRVPPAPVPVSFANQVRPLLFNPTNMGGAGCINCHGVAPGPANFYMGGLAAELFAELTTETPTDGSATGEPFRVNTQFPERSLVLINPLFGNPEPHPVKIFSDIADPRAQILYRWIAEGAQNN